MAAREVWGMIGSVNPNITFAPRPGSRRGAPRFFFAVVALGALAATTGALISGCSRDETAKVTATAQALPPASQAALTTIRTRVAAIVKTEVIKHPNIAPWMNPIAQKCFEVAGFNLPGTGIFQVLLGAASAFAPKEITDPVQKLLAEYNADLPAVQAVQGASKDYLTAFGNGIQDGVQQAAAASAPSPKVAALISNVASGFRVAAAVCDSLAATPAPTCLAGTPGEAP